MHISMTMEMHQIGQPHTSTTTRAYDTKFGGSLVRQKSVCFVRHRAYYTRDYDYSISKGNLP